MSEPRIRAQEVQLAELERRLANVVRLGRIEEVDVERGLARVRIDEDGEGRPVLTPWLPWTERAGAIRTWMPPAMGEQVSVHAPSGEIAQGWIAAGGFSTQYPAPHDRAAEYRMQIGDTFILVKGDEVEINVGGTRLTVTGDEIVTYGRTRLDDGGRPIHRIGDQDSAGDEAVDGAHGAWA